MIATRTALGLLMIASASAADRPDMLRFTNGDQLRGRYDGMREGPVIVWRNDDLAAPAEFKTTGLHQLVLREGRPPKPLQSLSFVELVNRDRLPGTLVAMDENTVTIETDFAGTVSIPRDHVAMVAPNPMGGRLHYHGPFSSDDWEQIRSGGDEKADADAQNEEAAEEDSEEASDDEEGSGEKPVEWVFTGSSWLWRGGNPGVALTRPDALPERSVLRFNLSWKNRLSLAIALHADFVHPEPAEGGVARRQHSFNMMDPQALARVFGSGHIIQLYNSYLSHLTTRVDEKGKITVARGARGNNNLRLGEGGRARIELRTNRRTGEVMLFVDDEYAAQWNIGDTDDEEKEATLSGAGIGFVVMNNDSPVRISDIVIAEWNGMPDSARSLQVADQDVVLMTNGTDRFGGKLGLIEADGVVAFEGRHGNFRLPMSDIAEIRLASGRQATAPETADPAINVRMGPTGAVSGTLLGGDAKLIQLLHPSVGRIELSLESATVVDFNPSHITIDDWNDDF